MSNKREQTKTRTVRQTIKTVTAFLITRSNKAAAQFLGFYRLKNSIYLSVLALVICFSLFLHLFAKPGQAGLLGWKWMSSFLNSLGVDLFVLSAGFLLLFLARHNQSPYRYFFRLLSKVVVLIGVFYTFYTFLPIRDYTNGQYYTMISGLSILFTVILLRLNRALSVIDQRVKRLVKLLFRIRDKHVKAIATKAAYHELQHPPVDGVPVADQLEDFENDVFNELKDLRI